MPDASVSGYTKNCCKQLKMIGYENQMSGTLRQGGRICQEHWRHDLSELHRTPQAMGEKLQRQVWDFAPYSFGFAERTPDGRNGIVGGLLYHGRPDESFAVMIGGPFHGWSIHT